MVAHKWKREAIRNALQESFRCRAKVFCVESNWHAVNPRNL